MALSASQMTENYVRMSDKMYRVDQATALEIGKTLHFLTTSAGQDANYFAALLEMSREVYRERFCKKVQAKSGEDISDSRGDVALCRKCHVEITPNETGLCEECGWTMRNKGSENTTPASFDLSQFIGTFTVVHDFDDDEYTTVRIKAGTGNFEGKYIASYLAGADNESDYVGFAFVNPNGSVNVWRKFSDSDAIAKKAEAVKIVLNGGRDDAREAYAMRSGKCSRCGRKLTVPASLHRGMGPECAKM